MRIRTGNKGSHADLAMQAARRVARAKRRSQKAKMGHEVCHHLLSMLNDETASPAGQGQASRQSLHREKAMPLEDKQFSLGF